MLNHEAASPPLGTDPVLLSMLTTKLCQGRAVYPKLNELPVLSGLSERSSDANFLSWEQRFPYNLWTLSLEQAGHWLHCKGCLFLWPFYSSTTIKASHPCPGRKPAYFLTLIANKHTALQSQSHVGVLDKSSLWGTPVNMGAHGKLFGLRSNRVGSQTPMCVFNIKTLTFLSAH